MHGNYVVLKAIKNLLKTIRIQTRKDVEVEVINKMPQMGIIIVTRN